MRSTGCKDRTGTVNNQTEYGHNQTVRLAAEIDQSSRGGACELLARRGNSASTSRDHTISARQLEPRKVTHSSQLTGTDTARGWPIPISIGEWALIGDCRRAGAATHIP
jgi:hypothetical protein